MDVQRSSASQEWSVWMCLHQEWVLCVGHVLQASLEMERSATVTITYFAQNTVKQAF